VRLYCTICACVKEAAILKTHPDEGFQEQANGIHGELISIFEYCEENGVDADQVRFVNILFTALQNMDNEFAVRFEETVEELMVEDFLPTHIPSNLETLDLAPPFEPHSPEDMITWMLERLTRRIKYCIENGLIERCKRNVSRRDILVAVLKVITRHPEGRPRAMLMMMDIPGVSDSD